jgi:PHD/YefM family antitoxin component YafN of YafNO toxin-antitoxin module
MPVRTRLKPEVFAEEIEYTNITEFREKLLRTVDELQKSPARQYLVTKHGKPHAVLMSFHAYQVFRKVAEEVLKREEGKDEKTLLAEAVQRMDEDYGMASGVPKLLELIREAMRSVVRETELAQTRPQSESEAAAQERPEHKNLILRYATPKSGEQEGAIRVGIRKLRNDLDQLETLVEEIQSQS